MGRYGEIGLSFLQGCLHPVHHGLHSFHVSQHIPAVQQNLQNDGMVARIQEEWCVAYSHIDGIGHHKLCKCQILTPTSRSSLHIWSQEILHDLDHLLTVFIYLQMKRRFESEIHTELVKKRLPKLAGETGIPIRYYHLWESG